MPVDCSSWSRLFFLPSVLTIFPYKTETFVQIYLFPDLFSFPLLQRLLSSNVFFYAATLIYILYNVSLPSTSLFPRTYNYFCLAKVSKVAHAHGLTLYRSITKLSVAKQMVRTMVSLISSVDRKTCGMPSDKTQTTTGT